MSPLNSVSFVKDAIAAVVDESLSIQEVDLTNCDREPIHIPSAIQPHGILLSLDAADLKILQVSQNITETIDLQSRF
jgi:two-component system, chemotaxis family, sensor kinase Cph1